MKNPHEVYINQQYIKDTKALLSIYIRRLKETIAEKDKAVHFLQNWVDEIANSNSIGSSSALTDIHKLNAKIDLLQTIISDLSYLCDGWE